VIFDTRDELAFWTGGFFSQHVIFQISLNADRELRIAQGTRVLNLNKGDVSRIGAFDIGFDFHLDVAP
jgi:hypothetical protein